MVWNVTKCQNIHIEGRIRGSEQVTEKYCLPCDVALSCWPISTRRTLLTPFSESKIFQSSSACSEYLRLWRWGQYVLWNVGKKCIPARKPHIQDYGLKCWYEFNDLRWEAAVCNVWKFASQLENTHTTHLPRIYRGLNSDSASQINLALINSDNRGTR